MRRLNAVRDTKEPLKIVKELDAFPKIEPCYVETTARSGGVTILMFMLTVILLYSEIRAYAQYEVVYEYGVDNEPSTDMVIYLDMTVATSCALIGADLLDVTGKHAIDHDNKLEEISTSFKLSKSQRKHQEMYSSLNRYLQKNYHSMHENIWDIGYSLQKAQFPDRPSNDKEENDACRFRGTLSSRKLSGNFHITMGKPIQMFGGGHAHLTMFGGGAEAFNFSHRIHHMSFGPKASGKVYPLDGDEHISTEGYHVYQYYLKVVPTKVNTRHDRVDTFQFSVTEMDRPINHSAGSHGTPGIFFKYEMSPIKVYVDHKYKPLWKFIVRLCGIVGGIFACTGILNSLFEAGLDLVCCRFKLGKYRPSEKVAPPMDNSSLLNATSGTVTQPLLAATSSGSTNNTHQQQALYPSSNT